MIEGQSTQKISEITYWHGKPFVYLADISKSLGIKWSLKDGMGIAEWNGNFLSFNTVSGDGLYDSIYYVKDVATNQTNPLVSVEALSKLLQIEYTVEPTGIFLIKSPPDIVINGAILYGNDFTLFFNKNPGDLLKIEKNGMVTDIQCFPIVFSDKYVPPDSPLVVENNGTFSVNYTITASSNLKVITSIGTPTFPIQQSDFINFGNGITYKSMVSTSLSGATVSVKMLKISADAHLRAIFPNETVGDDASLTSVLTTFAGGKQIAILGFDELPPLVYQNGELYGVPSDGSPILTLNEQKFDIIETDQVITVNIGNIPLVLKSVNTKEGNVILYTKDYKGIIPKLPDRIYVRVQDGRVVSTEYVERTDGGEVLSVNRKYSLSEIKPGQLVNMFVPFYIQNAALVISGKVMTVQNSAKVPSFQNQKISGAFMAATKDDFLYLIYVKGNEIDLDSISTLLINMGFTNVMYLGSSKEIFMAVDGKAINGEFGSSSLKFWIEIDKTTGGVDR